MNAVAGEAATEDVRPPALVIGAGLGGLTGAAFLAREGGLSVDVVERLSFLGGRFTQHDHAGHAVPTGALHMVPRGREGALAQVLLGDVSKGGLELGRHGLDFLPTTAFAGRQVGGEHEVIESMKDALRMFSDRDKLQLTLSLLTDASGPWPEDKETDGRTFVDARFTREVADFLDAFSGFAVSLRCAQMPASTVLKLLQHSLHLNRPAIPSGGCKGVIDALRSELGEHGVRPRASHEVAAIAPGDAETGTADRQFAVHVRRRGRHEGEWRGVDAILHNGGHRVLDDLLDGDLALDPEVRALIDDTQPVGGIGFVWSLDDDIPQRHSGVTMTPECERIGGYVIPTFSEPALAPPGRHLLVSHQHVPTADIQAEIDRGRQELIDAVPWLKDHGEELAVHAYHRNWPCNRTPQGSELPADVGIPGLRCVGDGTKSHGWMMAEGVVHDIPQVVADLRTEALAGPF